MQNKSTSVESVRSTIRSLEDNSTLHHNDGAKQSLVQNVTNTKLGGSDGFKQGHKGGKM